MANVHVGIMVNIVTLIVITVFCKRSFIIMNIIIIIIIIKGKQFCVARKTTFFSNYLSNSALSVQAILRLFPPLLAVPCSLPHCFPAFQFHPPHLLQP